MSTIAEILSIILALVFLFSGAHKFSGSKFAASAPEHFQIHPSTYRLAGILELLGALGLFLAAVGAIGTTLGWLAAFCLAALISKFRFLKPALILILAFVGIKLLLLATPPYLDDIGLSASELKSIKIDPIVSLVVVLGTLAVATVLSIVMPAKKEAEPG